ncbi:MAG TPA: hypothetical protein VGR92_06015 [Steroidobacteraceae bacterium]|nr:hypothetical protein [Steroidobacteraceae bacterium]
MADPVPIPIRIEVNLQWQVTTTGSGMLVGICPPLGLSTQGQDQFDLSQNIQEALQLMMNELLRSGELDSFLRGHGWRASGVPRQPTNARVPFDVPFQLVQQQQEQRNGPARAAH